MAATGARLKVTRQHWEQLLQTYDHSITDILDVLLEEAGGEYQLQMDMLDMFDCSIVVGLLQICCFHD